MASSVRQAVYVVQAEGARAQARFDELAAEEPLQIRVLADWQEETAAGLPSVIQREERTLSLTLRTPGAEPATEEGAGSDGELAVGFLFAEGLVSERGDVEGISAIDEHVVLVRLRPGLPVPWRNLERQGLMNSACGLCGRRSLDALLSLTPPPHALPSSSALPPLQPAQIVALPQTLGREQAVFARTGGLHAAALFDWDGKLRLLREDIGRHNAVDKLIGASLLASPSGGPALSGQILVVSGRAGFELVQKACRAGLPMFVAVGAPSSLAVRLAQRANLSLIGFCRDGRFNVYSGPERVAMQPSDDRP